MALLTRQETSAVTGVIPTYVAVSSSDTFPVDAKTFIYVKNAGGSSDTTVITAVSTCSQGSTHNGGGAVANATERVFGGFDQTRFADSGGLATITHSFTTSVTCAVVRLA